MYNKQHQRMCNVANTDHFNQSNLCKFSDEVVLHHLSGIAGVADILEGLSGVVCGVLDQDLFTARMLKMHNSIRTGEKLTRVWLLKLDEHLCLVYLCVQELHQQTSHNERTHSISISEVYVQFVHQAQIVLKALYVLLARV